MGGVFINYRGEDSDTAAVLVDRELTDRFGDDQVFLDSRSIPAGVDFAEELLGRLRACSVLLVVIGRRWLTLTDAAGARRIDDPRDWIRREIVEALANGLRVIPVLTDGVRLPAKEELPDDISWLSRRQYVSLRRRYASADLALLVKRIIDTEPELAKVAAQRQSRANAAVRRQRILTTAAALGAVVLILTGVVLWITLHASASGTPAPTTTSYSSIPSGATTVNLPTFVPDVTYTQTVNAGPGARAYANPNSLTDEGPRIPNRQNVLVSCIIIAPSAPSVGLYWYRITSPPWNDQYYAPANSFLNGDPVGGPYTHVVDPTVPRCP
jgi:TIR domain